MKESNQNRSLFYKSKSFPHNLSIDAQTRLGFIELNDVNPLSLWPQRPSQYTCLFSLLGDLNGLAITQVDIDGHFMADIMRRDFFIDTFIESSNVLLGHILTNLDNRFSTVSMLSSPVLLTFENESTQRSYKRKKNISSLINGDDSRIVSGCYKFKLSDVKMSLDLNFSLIFQDKKLPKLDA